MKTNTICSIMNVRILRGTRIYSNRWRVKLRCIWSETIVLRNPGERIALSFPPFDNKITFRCVRQGGLCLDCLHLTHFSVFWRTQIQTLLLGLGLKGRKKFLQMISLAFFLFLQATHLKYILCDGIVSFQLPKL